MSSTLLLYEELMKEGKELAAKGKLYESLSKFEHAKKIQPTPKVLQRIQKLKDFIKLHKLSHTQVTSDNTDDSSYGKNSNSGIKSPSKSISSEHKEKSISSERKENSIFSERKEKSISSEHKEKSVSSEYKDISRNSGSCTKSNTNFFKFPAVLNEIQNTKVQTSPTIPSNVKDLSAEQLAQFNKLKKEATRFSYEGKLEQALKTFQEALKICNCSVVKKFIEEIEFMIMNHSKKLQDFQQLTNTAEALAVEGRRLESLGKYKDAFAIFPSPKVSRIIQKLEKTDATSMKLFAEECSDTLTEKNDKTSSCSMLASNAYNTSESLKNEDLDFSFKKSITDPKMLSPEKLTEYKNLYKQAREDASEGKLQDALNALKKACSICRSEKVLNRIKDLKKYMKSLEEESNDQMVAVAEGFCIFHEIFEKLYPYQRLGVAWMWGLFQKRKGGVLGDDMGLGKTFQVIAFLSGLIDAELVKHILIIMPVSLLHNWEKEFKKWCPGIKVYLFHGTAKRERERNALRVQRSGHVLLTSYGMVVNNLDLLSTTEGERFIWDYVILDEGHKIKNPTKTTKAVHELPAKNRLVLTGTPIQNNLRELWALYNFVHQGALLGSMKTFKMQYENIITRAREKDATVGEKRLGTEMADNLKKLIQPYFLRRTKSEIWGDKSSNEVENIECKMAGLKLSENKVTTRKNDFIVWLTMTDQQCQIYRSFLHSDTVKKILVSNKSPLVQLTTLKKICDHPRLLSQKICLQMGLNGDLEEEEMLHELEEDALAASSIENVSDETLINESGKMKFLIRLLENLKVNGHRTLVFSLSRKILDMIHRILTNRQWKVIRIDGTITKIEDREKHIQLFQNNPSYSVFLLTTQVGGVGITLTAADRVVIYDPSWNPATDAQAVDRAYRIGQKKNVVVYRLMTCGTVEEKIYRRQIFKDSITRQATGSSDPYRYFSKQELRELFILGDPNYSATQVQLSQMHSGERESDASLDEHIAFLYSLDIFGISDHNLMFTKNVTDNTEDNDESAISHDYIEKKVAAAQQLIQAEASVAEGELQITGNYSRPYLESIKTFKKNSTRDLYKAPSLPEVIDLQFQSQDSFNNINQVKTTNNVIDVDDEANISVFSPPDKRSGTAEYKHKDLYKASSLPEVIDLTVQSQDSFNISQIKTTNNVIDVDDEANISVFSLPDKRSGTAEDKHKENGLSCNNKVIENEIRSIKYQPLSLEENKISDQDNMVTEDERDIKIDQDISIKDFSYTSEARCSPMSVKRQSKQLFNAKVRKYEEKLDISIKNLTSVPSPKPLNSSYKLCETPEKSLTNVQSSEITIVQNNGKENLSSVIGDCLVSSEEGSSENGREVTSDSERNILEIPEVKNIDDFINNDLLYSKEFNASSNQSLSDIRKSMLSPNKEDRENNFVETVVHDNCSKIDYDSKECKDFLHDEEKNYVDSGNESRFPSKMNNSCIGDNSYSSELNHSGYKKTHSNLSLNESIQEVSSVKMPKFEECRTSSPISGSHMQENRTLLLNESFEDLCNKKDVPLQNKRKSCARPSQLISDSDSSQPPSSAASPNTSQECIVPESEEEDTDGESSKNSTVSHSLNESISFVPSSMPSTPSTKVPVCRNNTNLYSPLSPRRITPLRLHKNHISSTDRAFAKALATSPLIHVTETETTLIELGSDLDSPVKRISKRRCRNAILSESEDSEGETVHTSMAAGLSSSISDQNLPVDSSTNFTSPISHKQSVNKSYLSYRSINYDSEVSDESE